MRLREACAWILAAFFLTSAVILNLRRMEVTEALKRVTGAGSLECGDTLVFKHKAFTEVMVKLTCGPESVWLTRYVTAESEP